MKEELGAELGPFQIEEVSQNLLFAHFFHFHRLGVELLRIAVSGIFRKSLFQLTVVSESAGLVPPSSRLFAVAEFLPVISHWRTSLLVPSMWMALASLLMKPYWIYIFPNMEMSSSVRSPVNVDA